MKMSSLSYFRNVLIGAPVLATLAVTPGLTYDPINLPKATVVLVGASFLLGMLRSEFRKLFSLFPAVIVFCIVMLLLYIVSILFNDAPTSQQLWGVWGRSTGIFTYLSLLIFLLAAALYAFENDFTNVRIWFERLSYVISLYTLMQAGALDPINWSQKLMVATLGNINFMSSFLGLVSISFLARILIERVSFTAKVQYAFFVSLNIYLIWISESIQGIGVLGSGLSILLMCRVRERLGLRASTITLLSLVSVGIVTFLGVAGLGPLSMFKQETVSFRNDYWAAGIRMVADNPLTGIGVDSYGDYYEQYRDLAAVQRTGPQRITNTAHNVFLDIASGAGVIAALAFVGIFLTLFFNLVKLFRKGNLTESEIAYFGLTIGYLFFLLVSINQIGIGIWGFIFMGILLGSVKKSLGSANATRSRINAIIAKGIQSNKHENKVSIKKLVVPMIGSLLTSFIAIQPVITDSKMLKSVQNKDFLAMRDAVERYTSTSFHKDKYLTLLIESGRDREALDFSNYVIATYPRSETALRIVAFSEFSTPEDRLKAVSFLKLRDPFNLELQENLNSFLRTLKE